MTDQALHDKIESYLLGKMPPEEAASFETDMRNDPHLAEEVELHRLILPVPDRLAELDLRSDFRRWRSEMESPDMPDVPSFASSPAKSGIPLRWRWAGGAVLLFLLSGAFLMWRHYEQKLEEERESRKKTEQALLDANLRIEELTAETTRLREDLRKALQADSLPVSTGGTQANVYVALDLAKRELQSYASEFDVAVRGTKSNTTPAQNRLSDANTAIQNKRYRQAGRILQSIDSSDLQYPRALEMLAYVYVQDNKFREAVSAYRNYTKYDSDTDKTDWNLCVFYLADYMQYKTAFQALLNKILNDPEHLYHSRATTLRQTLADKGIWPK